MRLSEALINFAMDFASAMIVFVIWVHWHLEEHWHERHERIAEERRRRREMKRLLDEEAKSK